MFPITDQKDGRQTGAKVCALFWPLRAGVLALGAPKRAATRDTELDTEYMEIGTEYRKIWNGSVIRNASVRVS